MMIPFFKPHKPHPAEERFFNQQVLFRHVIDDDKDVTVAVFFGPFPHPAAAAEAFEPHLYQVVWQSSVYVKPPPRIHDSLFIAQERNDQTKQTMIWLPSNATEASTILKDLFGLDAHIPELHN